MKTVLTLFAAIALLSTTAHADGLTLGEPSYGGSGCPNGSASTTLSPDQKSLSILFDEYIVEAGGEDGKRMARKSCNIAIPVHVPQGYSVSIFKVDYRGYAFVPYGGQGRFNVEYFFAGRRGPRFRKTFRGEYDDEFMLTNNLRARALVWSQCGADVNLRVNSSMMMRTNRWKEEALASVDSADVKSGIVYHIKWKRCY